MYAQKIKALVSFVGVGFVLALVLVCYLGYRELVSLHKRNEELTNALNETNTALKAEMERSARVEDATKRLESKDNERQVQLRRFESRLKTLASQSDEVRSVLSVVVPDELVRGLRAFPDSKPD